LSPIFVKIESSKYDVFNYLNESNIRFEILDQNFQKSIVGDQSAGKACEGNQFDYQYTYHNYNQIIAQMRKFRKKYLNFTQIVSIGKSSEGRNVMAIILSNKSNKIAKRKVFIECGIHAREWISTATCLWISNQLVTNNSDKQLLTRYEFIIIPSLNPDGYQYSWTRDRLWRKTRSNSNRSDCIGADPNRK